MQVLCRWMRRRRPPQVGATCLFGRIWLMLTFASRATCARSFFPLLPRSRLAPSPHSLSLFLAHTPASILIFSVCRLLALTHTPLAPHAHPDSHSHPHWHLHPHRALALALAFAFALSPRTDPLAVVPSSSTGTLGLTLSALDQPLIGTFSFSLLPMHV